MGRVVTALTVALVGALGLSGCGYYGSDHTVGKVHIVNDLRTSVRVSLCDHDSCRGGVHNPTELGPGDGGDVNVSTVGVPNVYVVQDPATGRRLGCLPLVMPRYVKGLVARVSESMPCRQRIDEHTQWPPG